MTTSVDAVPSHQHLGPLTRRWPTAAAVGLVAATYVPLEMTGDVGTVGFFAWGVVMSALAYFFYAAGNGALRDRGTRWTQALVGVGFATLALVGFGVAIADDAQVGRYVLAAGYLLHGVWDAVHFVRRRVVPRSWAEFCGVVDLLVGIAIIAMSS